MPNSPLVSSLEASEIMGMSRAAFNRRVRVGRVTPRHKVPGHTGAYLFDRAEIEGLAAAERAAKLAKLGVTEEATA